ncbi:hypothetical protein ANCCAN_20715 [Ancylostoma caninum]|uniref:Uncharacterized protein n=1 Tax=Ancylostoma caninum TaxID=29170 RepID=A0A368FMP2_ANCCA|nr:hypothetical protein ANCCAN_20715 [Ancylostoma caninum]
MKGFSGRFKCYGSCQHIKSKYGAGFTLLIRLQRAEQSDDAKNEVARAFPSAMLKVFLDFSRDAAIRPGDNNGSNLPRRATENPSTKD